MTLEQIEADIYQKGSVNRDHLLGFLRLQTNNDSAFLRKAVSGWLTKLHNDPYYSKVNFGNLTDPDGALVRILGDLDSYGRVMPETIIGAPPAPDVNLENEQ